MLTVGDKFPEYSLKATVGTDLKNAFTDISDKSYGGKWKVYFFWPKDFIFVCPTEISAFAKLNGEFKDRNATPRRQHGFGICSHGMAETPRRSERPALPDAR
jgi:alkyl hydroperoxide reductase subunit AhpC